MNMPYYAIASVIALLAMAECGYSQSGAASDPKSVKPQDGIFGSTFPGTLWCGPGNTANNRTQLGQLKYADRCCRDHDQCDDVILRFSKKNNLFNPSMSPRYNCKCDQTFKDCLLRVPKWETHAAEFIGSLYFESRIFPNCFTYDSPKKCVDQSKTIPWRCSAYENTLSKRKTWQWLDFGKWYRDFTA